MAIILVAGIVVFLAAIDGSASPFIGCLSLGFFFFYAAGWVRRHPGNK